MTAVRAGETKVVEKLISVTPDLVKGHDLEGATALHHAAGFGNLATMKLLLDKGADVNAPNRRKSTPLFWALHDEAKVRLLLAAGAKVDARSNDGRTPLYLVASIPNAIPVLRLLLDKGADVNAWLLTGATPLMAASRGDAETIRRLLEEGADVNAKSAAGSISPHGSRIDRQPCSCPFAP